MQYGYTVSQEEGLSPLRRQKILAVLIDNEVLTKNDIIGYLDCRLNTRARLCVFRVSSTYSFSTIKSGSLILTGRNYMSAEIIKFGENPSDASKQKKSPADYQKELQEVIDTVRSAKNNLGKISLHMEAEFPDAGALGEALEALDDAIDIMEDTLDEIE